MATDWYTATRTHVWYFDNTTGYSSVVIYNPEKNSHTVQRAVSYKVREKWPNHEYGIRAKVIVTKYKMIEEKVSIPEFYHRYRGTGSATSGYFTAYDV